MPPVVSVIMTTYNWNKKWIRESIESVLNQTFINFEFIIINDWSTNNIEDTISLYMGKDKRIIYLKNKKNIWITESLNEWINISKWKYIARIDDDDIRWSKNKLWKQVEFLEKNKDYAICWTHIITINNEWKIINKIHLNTSDKAIRNNILITNQFIHSWVLLNKEYVQKLWWYNIKYKTSQDYELWCRLWKKYKFANLEDEYTYYRINPHSISRKRWKKQNYNALKTILKNCLYYPNAYKWILNTIVFFIPLSIKDLIKKIFIAK